MKLPIQYQPIIQLPENVPVFDFSKGIHSSLVQDGDYGIGRYDEKRTGMYTTELFSGARDIHLGVDLFGPVNEPVYAFEEGKILSFGYNPAAGDYGYVIVMEHIINRKPLYALYGHLSARSIEGKRVGQVIHRGELLAWLGARHENGGWAPHVHFQLSIEKPTTHDMPGVVNEKDRARALEVYLDPRMVLGPLY